MKRVAGLAISLGMLAGGLGASPAGAVCAPSPVGIEESEYGEDTPGLHAAGDLDADGRDDAIEIGEDFSLAAVRGQDGATMWGRDDALSVYRAGDLDGVAGDDLIVRSSSAIRAGDAQQRELVLRGVSGLTGATLWTWSALMAAQQAWHEGAVDFMAPPTDLDGDGAVDLLLARHFREADTAFTRSVFQSISGKKGTVLAVYGGGIGTWYNPIYGPIRREAFAEVVPDLTGDCLPDVVVNASRLHVSALQAYPGKGGAPAWHVEIPHEQGQVSMQVLGAHLNDDDRGDVLLEVRRSSSEAELVGLSGTDGARLWSSSFPEDASQLALLPGADGTGNDILLFGPGTSSVGVVGSVDGSTGGIRWQRPFADAVPSLAGDLTGDGVDDLVIGNQRCVQGCVETSADLISGRDGTVAWSRPSAGGERLIPAEADLDGDAREDFFAFREGPTGQPSFYSIISGADGHLLWPGYRRSDDIYTILRVDTLDIRPAPGVDVLESFPAEDHAGPASRPGTDGPPIWQR